MRPGQDPLTGPSGAAGPLKGLPASFFRRPTAAVARALLGQFLLEDRPDGRRLARLVETEAYVARDRANHAFRGPTERNRSMFGAPGTWYIYRIHQVHCANVVTGRGEAVLLRAAEPLEGIPGSLSGPGRLARGFGLDRSEDGRSATSGRVRIVAGPVPLEPIVVGPRIGLSAGTGRKLRYALSTSRAVSSPRPPGWQARRA